MEEYRIKNRLDNTALCDFLVSRIYLPRLRSHLSRIPPHLLSAFPELKENSPAA